MRWNFTFFECFDCGHANALGGCECDNPRCICYKKNRGRWNGLTQINGGEYKGK